MSDKSLRPATRQIIRSKQADIDIQGTTKSSLAQFGEQQTRRYLSGMNEHFHRLANNPKIGRPYLRHYYTRYQSHVIYFRLRENDIFITRVLHVKMLPERHIV